MPIPAEAVAAYEALRLYLLQSSSHQASIPSAGILLRRGMLAWAGEQSSLVASTALPTLPLASLPSAANTPPLPSACATELVRCMADLILSPRKEQGYA